MGSGERGGSYRALAFSLEIAKWFVLSNRGGSYG